MINVSHFAESHGEPVACPIESFASGDVIWPVELDGQQALPEVIRYFEAFRGDLIRITLMDGRKYYIPRGHYVLGMMDLSTTV